MSWIAGIYGQNAKQSRKKIALMMEAAYPPSGSSGNEHPWMVSSVSEDMNGRALAQVSSPIPGKPLEYPYSDCQRDLVLGCDGHLYNFQALASKLSHSCERSEAILAQGAVAELLVHLLEEFTGGLEQKVREALIELDGDYALAVCDADQMVISRNSLGTKPLYFAEDDRFSAFASNKKPLWKIGLGNVVPLRAGKLAIFDHEGVSIKEALPFDKGETDIKSMAQAVDDYQEALYSAVRKRLDEVSHVDKVGVLLSGGVDSCLVAKLVHHVASDFGVEVIAYTAGLPDSPDVSFAREFAEEISIKHETGMLSIDEVEEYIPKVIEAVEDGDFVQVEAGIGIYAAMDMARQDGIKVILSGQGPDELWGGYTWYPEVLGRDGRQELCRRMWDDFTKADIDTLDRENKIAMAHGAEMVFPYLDTEVVNLAMSVASELKVSSEEDHLGKHPHRQLARRIGIPAKYANRSKDAAQHGTGIHNVLDEVARKEGFNPIVVKETGYSSDKVTARKMGSSSRYGYKYDEKSLWRVPQHVQFFLHSLAYEEGMLNKSARDKVKYFLNKARHSP